MHYLYNNIVSLKMTKYLVVVFLIIRLAGFSVIWAEDAWADFYHWGPPFKVGSIVIRDWTSWSVFVGLLVLYQGSQVYLEETTGRDIERRHMGIHYTGKECVIQQKKWSNEDVFLLSCYNFYRWLGTILHILVAVTRVDVWILIALVDTFARAFMWRPKELGKRQPRVYYSNL